MSTPYKFIQARSDFGNAISNWFKKNDWPQGITEAVAKEVNQWEGGPWASQVSTAINGKLDPKAAFFIAKGNFNIYIHAGDFSKIKDQALKEKLKGSKAFTHNNGRLFDGADFFRMFTGLIEVPKKYKEINSNLNDVAQKYGSLLREHFLKIKRNEMMSTKDAWESFINQPYAQTIKEEHLNTINDLFREDIDLKLENLEVFREYYGKCPVLPPFLSMSKVKLSKELNDLNIQLEKYVAEISKQDTNLKLKSKSTKKVKN